MPLIVVGRSEEDLKKFGEAGTIMIGKHLVGLGEDAHLTTPVMLDVVRPHIICLTGKRGEGKSYSMGVFTEEITKLPEEIKANLSLLLIDTQGIFWTMKSPNEQNLELLNDWSLKPQGFKVKVAIPKGQVSLFSEAQVEYDETFSFLPSELSIEDWLTVFGFDPNEPLGILLQQTMNRLEGNYDIDEMIRMIKEEKGFEQEKLALANYFSVAKEWGIFGESRAPVILQSGAITILDVSLTPLNVRSLLVALISRSVLQERIKFRRQEESREIYSTYGEKKPLCWIMIDEAHNFIPAEGKMPSSEVLTKIVKEGRQPGLTLVLATQRPEKLHPDALAQCDMIISHRLTAKADIDALKSIMQTYMLFDITKYINELPKLKGVAIVLDDNSERLYKIRIRPRQSWHAGSSPAAMRE